MKKFGNLIGIFGSIALIFIFFPFLALFGMIFPPIAFILYLSVGLFFCLLVIYVSLLYFPIDNTTDIKKALIAPTISVFVLLGIPLIMNSIIQLVAFSYLNDEKNQILSPINTKSIALKGSYPTKSDESSCYNLCLLLLLSGTAEKVVVIDSKKPHTIIDGNKNVVEYSWAQLGECPEFNFKERDYSLSRGISWNYRLQNIKFQTNLRLANGDCIVKNYVKLNTVDTVITTGWLHESDKGRHSPSSLLLTIKPIRAARTTVHQKDTTGEYQEQYRSTKVSYFKYFNILFPIMTEGSNGKRQFGWVRKGRSSTPEKIGQHDAQFDGWAHFLTQILGMNLSLENDKVTSERILEKIESNISQNRRPTVLEWDTISYFLQYADGNNAETRKIIFKVLKSPLFPMPPDLSKTVKKYLKAEQTDIVSDIVDSIFIRSRNKDEILAKQEDSKFVRTLEFVPAELLEPYFQEYAELTFHSSIKHKEYKFIRRLSVFGSKAVPTLLELTEMGAKAEPRTALKLSYEMPHNASMNAICLLGKDASMALPNLLELVDQGHLTLQQHRGGALTISILVRIGADINSLWLQAKKADGKITRNRFDRIVDKALSNTPDCNN